MIGFTPFELKYGTIFLGKLTLYTQYRGTFLCQKAYYCYYYSWLHKKICLKQYWVDPDCMIDIFKWPNLDLNTLETGKKTKHHVLAHLSLHFNTTSIHPTFISFYSKCRPPQRCQIICSRICHSLFYPSRTQNVICDSMQKHTHRQTCAYQCSHTPSLLLSPHPLTCVGMERMWQTDQRYLCILGLPKITRSYSYFGASWELPNSEEGPICSKWWFSTLDVPFSQAHTLLYELFYMLLQWVGRSSKLVAFVTK